jgi:hypothetical protein
MAYEQNHIAEAEKHKSIVAGTVPGFRLLIGLLGLVCLMPVLSGCATSYTGTHRFSNESLQHPEWNRPDAQRDEQTARDSAPSRDELRPDRPTPKPELRSADQYRASTDKVRVLSAEWLTRQAEAYLGETAGEVVRICTSLPYVSPLLDAASLILELLLSY